MTSEIIYTVAVLLMLGACCFKHRVFMFFIIILLFKKKLPPAKVLYAMLQPRLSYYGQAINNSSGTKEFLMGVQTKHYFHDI